MTLVSTEQARRIAVHAQQLDGSATGVLDTVRRLGFLQIDPIASVAPAQRLVLWSRLGNYDTDELERLLWQERALFEWDAFIWPIEDLPLVHALARRRRTGATARERWSNEYLRANASFQRYVVAELERNGPMLSRDLQDRSHELRTERHRWWGTRNVTIFLELLHSRGVLGVAGRRNGQRLWDLWERCHPATEPVPPAKAEAHLAGNRRRALGVRLTSAGWEAQPAADDSDPPDRVTFLSPFDQLIHNRTRAEALFGFRYRLEMYVPKPKREYGYYVLPILRGDRLIGRIEPRLERKTGVLHVEGVWAEPGAPADAGDGIASALRELAGWLGVAEVRLGRKVPRAWASALRAVAR
jgi:uncharacterized protein YcaQ